ncbi:glycosyltransferase family 4 protein [bacterium]|nr:glycosyltransferase family 4 protein [bacterium]
MKKVLHIITRLDPGGSAENTVLSTERVNPERFESYVICGNGLTGEGPPEKYVTRLREKLIVEPSLVRPIKPLLDSMCLFAITRHINRLKPDIVHLHSAKAGAVGRVAVKLSKVPCKVIYTPHGHVFSGYGSESASKIFTFVEKRLAKWTDAIVGLTEDEIVAFRNYHAGNASQYCVIPSGVELDKYRGEKVLGEKLKTKYNIAPDKPLVGFIGRLAYVKGPDIFLEIAAAIRKSRSDVHFLLVGEGDMHRELEAKADELGLSEDITWTGWLEDPVEAYSAIDLLLLTSRNEGMGRVIVEAASAGKPVIALRSGGVEYVIKDKVTGLLFEHNELDKFATAVVALLDNTTEREKMGKAADAFMHDTYSVESMIKKLENLYWGLMEGKNASASVL